MERLGLSLLAGGEYLDREFTGVHITDLPDPGRYLGGGELVLTGLMWRTDPADSERFAEALRGAGVAAVGAGRARLGMIPDDLVRACAERGLPVFAVPEETSFREITEVLGARLTVDVRDALGRHRRLVAAVAEGAGLTAVFDLTARELHLDAAVVSATGEVIVGDLAGAPLDRLAHVYLTAPRLPHVAPMPDGRYTVFGVCRGHRAAGWALICAGDLTEQVDLGYELAACVALERTRLEEGRRVERRLAEQLVSLAVAGGEPAEVATRFSACGIDPAEPYAVVAAVAARPRAGRGPDAPTLGGQIVEELAGGGVVAHAGADGAVAVVPLGDRETVAELAGRLRDGARALAQGVPEMRVSIGVSGALTGAAALRGGAEEAGHARRLAEARNGGVVTSDEIYTHDLLLATVPGDVRRSFAARLLDPLLDYDGRHQSELVRTLGAFLDCAGSWNMCAERLHVHVNTVRYRIRRVEELTGRDLSTMTDRVDLFLALRIT
ncbi:PucR family transcriptional regulator [Spongiactinospora sp. TRM90649]|uniref:PucR family transcriptional regulator n=1 Tax=Spongiactinospora sp. TRM90649 TaxID=3031114 RepID=UPI0023F7789C|nr:PucR family transcriptional regulator [Spongiactinospora sp. TRM90649]